MRRPVSLDESLITDEPSRATAGGLSYPFGEQVPGLAEALPIAPGVRWARLPLSGELGHINVWLIDDRDDQGDGVAIVDTGMLSRKCTAAWEALLAGPLAGTRVTRVIVTHFHPDHVGMAGWLCQRFGVALWMTREEWLLGRLLWADQQTAPPEAAVESWRFAGWSAAQLEDAIARGWSSFARIVSPIPHSFVRIADGDMLDFAGARWRVVVGRGHAPEHACLLNEDAGLMISGDQILPAISSNISVPFHEPWGDPLGDWLKSIERMQHLPPDLLVLPSHGELFHGVRERLTYLHARHRERLDALLAALEEPRRIVDCFPILFRREVVGFDFFPATGEALAHLRRLECEDRVKREIDDQGVGWFSAVH